MSKFLERRKESSVVDVRIRSSNFWDIVFSLTTAGPFFVLSLGFIRSLIQPVVLKIFAHGDLILTTGFVNCITIMFEFALLFIMVRIVQAAFSMNSLNLEQSFRNYDGPILTYRQVKPEKHAKYTVSAKEVPTAQSKRSIDSLADYRALPNPEDKRVELDRTIEAVVELPPLYVGDERVSVSEHLSVLELNRYIQKSLDERVDRQPFIGCDTVSSRKSVDENSKDSHLDQKVALTPREVSRVVTEKIGKKYSNTKTSIYLLRSPFETIGGYEVKIGESKDLLGRMTTYRHYWKDLFEVLAVYEGTVEDERLVQSHFSDRHITGEYYDLPLVVIDSIRKTSSLNELLKNS